MTPGGPQDDATPDAATSMALDWFARRQGGVRDPGQERAFVAWLNADAAHIAAYARVEALWRAPSFAAAVARQAPSRHRPVPRPAARRVLRLAASVAAMAVLGAGGLRLAGIPLRLPADYATDVGTEQVAQLEDGTQLVLDTASAVDVRYNGGQRQVILKDGRIFVSVAPDGRPFQVVAGSTVIRDIGTAFSVERDGDAVTVAVRQGEVGIRSGAQGTPELHLRANEAGGYANGRMREAMPVTPDIAFAWLDHRLFFQEQPLGAVVDALRRYQRGWIVVANPALRRIKVSGGYDLRDPVAAIHDLARLSGASFIHVSDRLLILR